jgi:hypothetical protein
MWYLWWMICGPDETTAQGGICISDTGAWRLGFHECYLVLQDPAVILPDIESKTSSLRAMDKNYLHAGASTARSYFSQAVAERIICCSLSLKEGSTVNV